MHLDPQGEYWSPPRRLAVPNPIPASCASPHLPSVPPLSEHWTEWRTWAKDPGIEGGCRGSFDKVKSASYSGDSRLRIHLEYRSGPTARHTLSSMGVGACDSALGQSDRFCFDRWGPVDWVIDWSDARIELLPGDGTPGYGAIHEGRPSAEASVGVPTPAGTFKVKNAWKGKRLKVKITVSAKGAVKQTVTVKVSGKVR